MTASDEVPRIACACNCGRPRRYGSKYASERCQQAVSRRIQKAKRAGADPIKTKCVDRGAEFVGKSQYCVKHRRIRSISAQHERNHLDSPHHRGATIYYHGVGMPDHMTAAKAQEYLMCGAFERGDEIIIGNRRIKVEANQRKLILEG